MHISKQKLKRGFIYGIVASLLASAFMGIFVITQGNFDALDWRILGTTVTVGAFSITSLASLRTLESKNSAARSFSRLSILISLAAFAVTDFLIWSTLFEGSIGLVNAAYVLTILAVSSAHACLLLPLANESRSLRSIVATTLGFIAIVAGLLIYLVVQTGDNEVGEQYYRTVAVFAILDVLGTILTPIVAKFLTHPVAASLEPTSNLIMPAGDHLDNA